MDERPDLARIAAALGEPARARMIAALMSGRALTATELALEAAVVPSTASAHLRRLQDAGIVVGVPEGRHRYFRLADAEVADAIEALTDLAARSERRVRVGPSDPSLRRARVCYDHLAGEMGVRLLDALCSRRVIVGSAALTVSEQGRAWLTHAGIDLDSMPATRRPLCRACLDWSERRSHLGGALGASILRHVFTKEWAHRERDGRAVHFSPRGARAFERFLVGPEG